MKKVLCILTIVSLTGCYATIGTQGAIREHHRGINGGNTIAKAKNDDRVSKGYWESISSEIASAWSQVSSEESGS